MKQIELCMGDAFLMPSEWKNKETNEQIAAAATAPAKKKNCN